MSLLQLPPELLLHILIQLGSQFFAENTRRLTVSQTWYRLAWTVLLRDLRFTAYSIQKFTENESMLRQSSPYIVSMHIDLTPRPHPGPSGLRPDTTMAKLAAILPQFSALQSLHLQVHGRSSAAPLENLVSLNALHIANLLLSPPPSHLTSLDLDTAACHLRSRPNHKPHLCNAIRALLPSLRRLRCRMEEICETILQYPHPHPHPSSSSSPVDTAPVLEEVIINLSISQYSDTITTYRYSKSCHDNTNTTNNAHRRRSFSDLKAALETQAVTLAARLPNARRVRIISHELPSLEICAFDAVTGRRVKLGDNVEWDAQGKVVDEEEEGEEEEESGSGSGLLAGESPVEPVVVW